MNRHVNKFVQKQYQKVIELDEYFEANQSSTSSSTNLLTKTQKEEAIEMQNLVIHNPPKSN